MANPKSRIGKIDPSRNPAVTESKISSGRRGRFCLAIGLVTVTGLGAILRFSGLGDRDFWFDESCTFVYVSNLFHSSRDFNFLQESTNPLFYILLSGWVSCFGDSERAFRAFSALAATLTVPLIGLAAWRVRGGRAGLICATLAAFHPLHIHYAHEARAYALWLLLMSVALLVLLEAVRRSGWRWWVAYGLLVVGCLFVHYYTVFWLAGTIGLVVYLRESRRVLFKWLMTLIGTAVAFAPYFIFAVLPAARGGGNRWIESDWTFFQLLRSMWVMLPCGNYPAHLRGLSTASPDTVVARFDVIVAASEMVPVVILLSLIVAFAFAAGRRVEARRAIQKEACSKSAALLAPQPVASWRIHLALGIATVVPLLLAGLYSVWVRPIYLVGRYDMAAWPTAMVCLALIIEDGTRYFFNPFCGAIAQDGRKNALSFIVCAVLILCSLVPIERMAALKPGPSFARRRAERLAQLASPGDIVLAFSYDRDYLEYYLHRARFRGRLMSYPSWLERQVGWLDTESDREPSRQEQLLADANQRANEVLSALQSGQNALILADSLDPDETGSRGGIHSHFYSALEDHGLSLVSLDSSLGVSTVHWNHPR